MHSYKCSSCGKLHEGPPSLEWERPYHYFTIPEAERAKRCITTSTETCVIDNDAFYVHACVEIPVKNTDQIISFATWVTLSKQNFEKFSQLLTVPLRDHEAPFFAWLSEPIPTYPESEPLKTYIHLRNHGVRPYVELEPTEYPLAVEQREGASEDRVQQLFAWLENGRVSG